MRTGDASLLHIEPIANAVAELRAEGVSLDQGPDSTVKKLFTYTG